MIKNHNDANLILGNISTARRYFNLKGFYIIPEGCTANNREYWLKAYRKEITLEKKDIMPKIADITKQGVTIINLIRESDIELEK